MASLYNINHEGAYDGQKRSLEDLQFDLESVLTMSQQVGKSAEERNAASVTAGHPCRYHEQDCSRGCGGDRCRRAKAQWTKRAVRGACGRHCRRAKVIVREDNTKNGGLAWARLRERFGRDSGATSLTALFQYSWPNEKPVEDVWREWAKKVSKIPQGSLSSQAIEQLTISGLSRHGQPELENQLRLRAPMAWQDIQTQVEK